MIILLFIVIIAIIYILVIYNIIIKQLNSVKHAKSSIDVYLTQRFDLIPNLVECVKGYTKYEKDLFDKIITLRTEFMIERKLKKGSLLDREINKIMVILEDYPDLKANEQFLNLQKNLTKMENQIQSARRIYNNEVEKYNNLITVFPNNIIAKVFKLNIQEFFQMEGEQ
ncbi:MAG: hypothetical protein DBY41_12175 [Clostridium sp.]|nr:MAG: hypothetical protein DBY41_12175 [Clostridium sp.]